MRYPTTPHYKGLSESLGPALFPLKTVQKSPFAPPQNPTPPSPPTKILVYLSFIIRQTFLKVKPVNKILADPPHVRLGRKNGAKHQKSPATTYSHTEIESRSLFYLGIAISNDRCLLLYPSKNRLRYLFINPQPNRESSAPPC